MNYSQAKTANEVIKVKKCQHQCDALKNSVLDHTATQQQVQSLIRQERVAWHGWPAIIAESLSQRLNVDVMVLQTRLQQRVDEQLNELSECDIHLN